VSSGWVGSGGAVCGVVGRCVGWWGGVWGLLALNISVCDELTGKCLVGC
jgi:hypothetical protein